MDYQQMIDSMSPEIYQSLKRSVELGKWPDGKPLTPEQRQHAMQAIIACSGSMPCRRSSPGARNTCRRNSGWGT